MCLGNSRQKNACTNPLIVPLQEFDIDTKNEENQCFYDILHISDDVVEILDS